jgi:hypothetical protein
LSDATAGRQRAGASAAAASAAPATDPRQQPSRSRRAHRDDGSAAARRCAPLAIMARSPLAAKYAGPDAALLQLQADAIALALEAFGTAPVQPVRAAAPAPPR